MPVTVELYVSHPDLGMLSESEFDQGGGAATLLHPDAEAALALADDTGEVVLHDDLAGLIPAACIGGLRALEAGKSYRNVSFAGFDGWTIAAEGEMAVITGSRGTLRLPRDETVAALRSAALRLGELLRDTFPDDPPRWQDLLAVA